MKNLLALIFLCIIISCSSDSSELDTNSQPEPVDSAETSDENAGNSGGEEPPPSSGETKSISYNLSVFTIFEEKPYEFNLVNGDLIKDGELLEVPESISFISRFKVEKDKFFIWDNNGQVWSYNVVSQEKITYADYFDIGDGSSRFNVCTVPSYDEIFTFYSTNEDPSNEYYFVESYNTDSGQTYQVNLPNSALAVLNCSPQYKTGSKDMLLYVHLDENDNPYDLGIVKLTEQSYTGSTNLGLRPFALNADDILIFSKISNHFHSYNTNSNTLSTPTSIYYESEDLSESSVLLGFKSDNRFPARFEAGKMMYYNGSGEISISGNISEFYGPAILDIDSGALEVFSSLKIYQTYSGISEGRFNLEILQSEIDLDSETIVVTYHDVTFETSPFGIMILDFDLNLLRHYEFGQSQPIAMIKY